MIFHTSFWNSFSFINFPGCLFGQWFNSRHTSHYELLYNLSYVITILYDSVCGASWLTLCSLRWVICVAWLPNISPSLSSSFLLSLDIRHGGVSRSWSNSVSLHSLAGSGGPYARYLPASLSKEGPLFHTRGFRAHFDPLQVILHNITFQFFLMVRDELISFQTKRVKQTNCCLKGFKWLDWIYWHRG